MYATMTLHNYIHIHSQDDPHFKMYKKDPYFNSCDEEDMIFDDVSSSSQINEMAYY